MHKPLSILYLFFFVAIGLAQQPLRYTTKNGLPSNTVYDIKEDKQGFMWFATNRGVVKFDGETFKTFTNKDGLPNNDTWKLDIDNSNRVWYMAKSNYQGYIKNDSVYKFRVENDEVISPTSHKNMGDSIILMSGANYSLKDSLWIKDLQVQKVYEELIDVSKSQFVYYISKDVYILMSNDILYRYDALTKTRLPIPVKTPYSIPKPTATGIGALNKDLHFIHLGEGILLINSKTNTYEYHSYNAKTNPVVVKCNLVNDLIQVSFPEKLFYFNTAFEKITPRDLPNSNFDSAYKDSNGNLWLANLANGITMIPASQEQATYYFKNEKVQRLDEVNGTLYSGLKGKGFFRYNNEKKLFDPSYRPGEREIYKIVEDQTLEAIFLSGLHTENEQHQQISFNYTDGRPVSSNATMTCFKDIISYHKNTYYLGSVYWARRDSTSTTVKVFSKLGLKHFMPHQDVLYVSGSDGLHYIENDSLHRAKNTESLSNISVTTMHGGGNKLYIGTDGYGLYMYKNQQLSKIDDTEGLSTQRIIPDNNHLWVATQKGVKVFRLDSVNFSSSPLVNSYYEEDGLLENNLNDIYLKDSILFAASDQGLTRLELKDTVSAVPKVYFKTPEASISMSYEKDQITSVSFGAIDFSNQKNLSFSYKLMPLREEWQPTETKTLNLSNLSPGEYTLWVKVMDQHQNSDRNKIQITILPLWWQTLWAKILFVICGILAFALFGYVVKFQIKKSERKKGDRDKRYANLELQALRSQMNPHFVHNSLNAIQYFIQRNEVELSEDYLSKFSKLIRLFFEYSRRQNISLADEIELLTNYLEMEKLRFEEKLSYSIKVNEKLAISEQIIPSMILQPIVENAVNHGVFHKKGPGHISLKFDYINENSFSVSIEDDGIGINKAKKIYNTSSKNYRSNSSTILQERLELLKQSKSWEIHYSVKDLKETSEQTGTLVQLLFKNPDS